MATADLSQTRILIVEDDENNRIVISRLLALVGASKERITQVEEDPLRSLGSEGGFDLVLLDLHIPRKDGYSILPELRADPRFAAARIIALTANVMQDDLEKTRQAGFDGFIGKPINAATLKDTILKILSGEPVWTL